VSSDERRAVLYGVVVAASFVAIDIALGKDAAISSSYGLGAIVAGVLGGFRPAAIVSTFVIALAAASGLWNSDFPDEGYWARFFVAFCGALLALGAGRLRDEVVDQLGRQQMLMEVANLPAPGATLDQTVARVTEMLVPRYADFAAIDTEVAGERVRVGLRGSEPIEPSQVIETPLRARGLRIGTLAIAGGRSGADNPEFLRVFGGRVALALDNTGLSAELVSVEQQLEAILENLGEAVTVQDRSGRLVFANSAAAELLDADSVEELLATPPHDLVERFSTVNEDGSPLDVTQLPGRIVLEGGEPAPLVVRATNRATGEERWRVTKSTAVRGPAGDAILAVNVIEDITETKRAERAQRLLADASSVLASSLDSRLTLGHLAELCVPALADGCAISIYEGGDLQSIAAAGETVDTAERAVVPMATPERDVGEMALGMASSGRKFSDDDLELARELARRAATATENARLYNQLENVATTLQRSLLPPELPEVPGWGFRSLYLPAGGETDVGGDFYDVFPTAAGWMAVMGDVVGRGPAAASLTAMGRYTLRTAGSLVGTPTMGVARLNENLRARGDMALCTAAIVLLREDGGDASLVCAGHPLPYLVRDGEAQAVGRTGPLLGAFDQGHWLAATLDIRSGDVLVLYTDGVLDARGPDSRFGEERLEATLAGVASAEQAVERIQQALLDFGGPDQDDDIAALAIQRM
jgi:serine phosphatase RsbU (regulator of sigma subunit)/PAS domain-containing protein